MSTSTHGNPEGWLEINHIQTGMFCQMALHELLWNVFSAKEKDSALQDHKRSSCKVHTEDYTEHVSYQTYNNLEVGPSNFPQTPWKRLLNSCLSNLKIGCFWSRRDRKKWGGKKKRRKYLFALLNHPEQSFALRFVPYPVQLLVWESYCWKTLETFGKSFHLVAEKD